jgi:hypothetical protein
MTVITRRSHDAVKSFVASIVLAMLYIETAAARRAAAEVH